MIHPTYVYLVVGLLWLLCVVQGLWLMAEGLRFYRYVRDDVRRAPSLRNGSGGWRFAPRVAVILPCCGVDERLEHTVESLRTQQYPDYEVVFTFESAEDPAYAAITEWTRDWKGPVTRRVIAGMAEVRGQKVHNLLAAVSKVSADREVYVFLDSDAIPAADWIGHLVAPLEVEQVGASTGFRWYAAGGSFANGVRCLWNAASLTLITDPKLAFVWGGATAIRRKTFEKLDIAGHWQHALSDDYQVTRAVREAGLSIHFVPYALTPSHDRTTLAEFWSFARRQIIITRICGPAVFRSAFILCANFIAGGTAVALLFFAALFGWYGDERVMWLALAGCMSVCGIACTNSLLRQLAVRRVLASPDVTWRDFAWDVGGVNLSGLLHMSLMLSALNTRRITWRHIVYELVSPDETLIVGRLAGGVQRPVGSDGSGRGSGSPATESLVAGRHP